VDQHVVYIGTYTVRGSLGIYASNFDPLSGQFDSPRLQAETINPAFLAIHKNGRFLYAVSEINDYNDQRSGAVRAYAIDRKTSGLTLLNEVSSGGAGPCYISIDGSGKYVLVANYHGGSVAVFPILEDGRLGGNSAFVQHYGSSVNPARQKEPHTHSIATSPDNRFAIAADLGLDQLLLYGFDVDKGSLAANNPPFAAISPGGGPRHFVFDPRGSFLYTIDEIASTVSVFSYDPRNTELILQQTISSLSEGFSGNNEAADIHIDAQGKFLYASNRGQDSIKVFAVDEGDGTLASVGDVASGGKTPRNFAIDPSGNHLIVGNEDSDNLVTFHIDRESGKLSPTGNVVKVPSPVCIVFLPQPQPG
jgi:6-phosphogluconolactonase